MTIGGATTWTSEGQSERKFMERGTRRVSVIAMGVKTGEFKREPTAKETKKSAVGRGSRCAETITTLDICAFHTRSTTMETV